MHYEGEGEGYVWWVRGKPNTQHETTLTMLVPLAAVGDETRLKLFTPRATASELKLTVPLADAVGKVSEGRDVAAGRRGQERQHGVRRCGPGRRLPIGLAQVESAVCREALGVGGRRHGSDAAGPPLVSGRGHAFGAKLRRPLRPLHRAIAAGDEPFAGRRQRLRRDARGGRRKTEGQTVFGRSAIVEGDDRAG